MLVFALLLSVAWAQTPSNPTCCSHSYWTGRCTACPGYWYQTCNSGYRDADQKGCGFLGCTTKCYNSCRYKNYGCGCNNSTSCHKRNCVVSGWSGWGSCSKACGTGTQSRTRRITTNAAYGGTACPSSLKETRNCNTNCCKVSCAVSGFGGWGSCSKACGTGTQRRTRSITRNASCGGTACPALFENRNCNTQCCKVNCAVSGFGGWGTCSKGCGGGTQRRTRTITRNASCSGIACPALTEDRACNTHECTPDPTPAPTITPCKECYAENTDNDMLECANGKFGAQWTGCLEQGSVRVRCPKGFNVCNDKATNGKETFSCWTPSCDEHGGPKECITACAVSEFSDWSTCSAECGGGTQKRTRSVTTAASCGGAACPALEEERECNTQCCAVDCVVGAFREWGTCSAECGGGKQTRSRSITTNVACGGAACPALEEEQECNTSCCAVDCVVGSFSEWGTCSEECGGGKQTRSRSITTDVACGGATCPALEEEQDCNTDACATPNPTDTPTESPPDTSTTDTAVLTTDDVYCAEAGKLMDIDWFATKEECYESGKRYCTFNCGKDGNAFGATDECTPKDSSCGSYVDESTVWKTMDDVYCAEAGKDQDIDWFATKEECYESGKQYCTWNCGKDDNKFGATDECTTKESVCESYVRERAEHDASSSTTEYDNYIGKNTWSGNGSTNLEDTSTLGTEVADADACKQRCTDDVNCDCVIFRADSDKKCLKRSDCVPDQFKDSSTWDTYVKKETSLCDETDNFEVDGACCPSARTRWDSTYSTAEECCDSDIVRADGQCGAIDTPSPTDSPTETPSLCDETDNFEVNGACCPSARTRWDSTYSTAEECCDSDIVRADGQCGAIDTPSPTDSPTETPSLCDETDNFEVDGACCPSARTRWDSTYSTAEECCESDIVRADGQCGAIATPAPVADPSTPAPVSDPSTPAPVAKCPVQLVSAQKFATDVKAKGKKKIKAANVDALACECETMCADDAKYTFWYVSKIKKGKQGSCTCLEGEYKSFKKNKKSIKGAAGGLTEAARAQFTAAQNAGRRRRRRGGRRRRGRN